MSQFYYVAQVVRSAALAAAVAAVALHRIGVGARPLLGAGLRLGLAVAVPAITSLLEHIRSGSLTDDQGALVAELVAAFQARNEPEPEPLATTSLTAGNARRTDLLAQIALSRYAGYISGD